MSIKDIYSSIFRREEHRGERKRSDLLYELRKEIKVLRRVGEKPNRDRTSFSKYFCDLCGRSYVISSLVQCNICGRWICRDSCLSDRYNICNSCNGVLELLLDSRDYCTMSTEPDKSKKLKKTEKEKVEGDTNGR